MRIRVLLVLSCLALIAGPCLAKFGMFKTRVTLPRVRPPENPPIGYTVYLDARSAAPEVTGSYVATVEYAIESALRSGSPYRLVDRKSDADVIVTVVLSSMTAEVRDEVRTEHRRVKVGEQDKWNEKKKKNEKEDIYENRHVPVPWRIAEARVTGYVQVGDTDRIDLDQHYGKEFKQQEYSSYPSEVRSEEALRRYLIDAVAAQARAVVAFTPDPVEALLAVNGELKDGNKLAEAGQFEAALAAWTRRTYKGDTEAARLHNVGVAHEAIAYTMPLYTPEHRSRLTLARDFYQQARSIDPDEKYFKDPLARIATSLSYAASAALMAEQIEEHRAKREHRKPRPADVEPPHAPKPVAEPGPAQPSVPARSAASTPSAKKATQSTPDAIGAPLRNGSFESGLPPWAVNGKGNVVEEAKRGRVLDLGSGASLTQSVDVVVPDKAEAGLSLDYRVTAGEVKIRASIGYVDAQGKIRNATIPVTAGEGPGSWSAWSNDLSTLRPRPSRIREVKVVVEDGTARVDNVALTLR